MLLLSTSQAKQISGGTAKIAGYTFATPNINPSCAAMLTSRFNYDYQAGNWIGYDPNQTNPFYSSSHQSCSLEESVLFTELMRQAIPTQLIAPYGFIN